MSLGSKETLIKLKIAEVSGFLDQIASLGQLDTTKGTCNDIWGHWLHWIVENLALTIRKCSGGFNCLLQCGCTGWSESLLFAQVILQVLLCAGSVNKIFCPFPKFIFLSNSLKETGSYMRFLIPGPRKNMLAKQICFYYYYGKCSKISNSLFFRSKFCFLFDWFLKYLLEW